MPRHDIIVIGASAGGVEAVSKLVHDLPVSLPAALFVVIHIPPDAPSLLPRIMTRAGALEAIHPQQHQPIEPGRIYIAPPDHHLLLRNGVIHLTQEPREKGQRPAVDPLMRSAAQAYGPRVVGVVLSGNLDDGTAGLAAVKALGGKTIIQDPTEALYPGMPTSALGHVAVDYTLPLAEIAPMLVRLAIALQR